MSKKIIINFDGTNNHPSDAKQEREWFGSGDIEDSGITNILKLHVLFGGDLANSPGSAKQHSFYYSGVGTYGNRFQQIFNAALAPENLDVGTILKKAGKDLSEAYKAGDEIYVFGFSRGAALARRFCAVLDRFITWPTGKTPVQFLGVFDTVASIGVPNLDSGEKPMSDVVFENGSMSKNVKKALHLVSVDENRLAFEPTLINQDKRVTEIWMPGAHSDVGGGFWFDGLSDIALDFMIAHIKREKLGLNFLKLSDVKWQGLVAKDGSYAVDQEDIVIKPLIKGKSHPKDRWLPIAAMTLGTRKVRVNTFNKAKGVEEVSTAKPLIHEAVGKRIKAVTDYRPRALKGVQHSLVLESGKTDPGTFNGLMDY